MTSDKLCKANDLSKEISDLKSKISNMELYGVENIKLLIGTGRAITIGEKDIVNLVYELSESMLKRKLAALEKEFEEL